MQNKNLGTLYVVATPIGNLQDMTMRAVEVLRSVSKIAAEDTRQTGKLLKHFGIEKPIISLHEFNERERVEAISNLLNQGESVALVSDAGTPLISDPGYHLVQAVHSLGAPIVAIPGACAAIAALSVSGLPTDRFCFEGFLPVKSEAKRRRLERLLSETRTMIFYEAPHRVLETLEALDVAFGGNRKAVVARELTKMYEQVVTSTLKEVTDYFKINEDKQRGEFVILVEGGCEESEETSSVHSDQVLKILLSELSIKQAASLASKITGERKNILYEKALKMQKKH